MGYGDELETRGAARELIRQERRRDAGRPATRPPLAFEARRTPPSHGEIPEGNRSAETLRRDARLRRSLALADLCAALLAVLVVVTLVSPDTASAVLLITLPGVVLVAKAIGLYDRDDLLLQKTTLDEAPKLFQVSALFTLALYITSPLFIAGTLGPGQVAALWAALLAGMLAFRTATRAIVTHFDRPDRCLVIGEAEGLARLAGKFDDSFTVNVELSGRVPLSRRAEDVTPDSLGSLDMLGLLLVEHDIDRVIIAPGPDDHEEIILHAIRLAKALGVKVSVLPRLFEVVGSSVEFDYVDGLTLLGVRPYGLSASSQLLKRSMDIAGAGLTLLLLAPLLAAIALAVKLTSPGPVFFRQPRIGRQGRRFTIIKFRTMYRDAEERKAALRTHNETEGLFKMADDPRVTSVGRFLRRTSLDELPQLCNVLRGEMSLVGPRPLVPDEDTQVQGFDRRRLHVLPGMTGFWQILASGRVPLHEMVKIDYLYGANWSLWQDCKILLRTLPYVFARRGL